MKIRETKQFFREWKQKYNLVSDSIAQKMTCDTEKKNKKQHTHPDGAFREHTQRIAHNENSKINKKRMRIKFSVAHSCVHEVGIQ